MFLGPGHPCSPDELQLARCRRGRSRSAHQVGRLEIQGGCGKVIGTSGYVHVEYIGLKTKIPFETNVDLTADQF